MLTQNQLTEQDKIRLTDSDSDLLMFSYISCCESDSDLVKQCRGIIFHNKKLIVPSFGWTAEYTEEDKDKINTFLKNGGDSIRIFDSHEGCLLRVYNFKNQWYISTHRKLNAFNSKWSSKKYWGEMFKDALDQELEQFFTSLDTTKIYFFVVRNNEENRIICDAPENPTIFHVGTMYKNNDEWIRSFDEDIGIQKPQEFHNNNLDQILKYVEDGGYNKLQGVIVFTNNKIFKICNKTYYNFLKIRGNEASIKFRYLQIRMNKKYREQLIFLYPNYKDAFELYEESIFKIALELTKAYMMRFIRGQWKQVAKDEYESIIRPIRDWHLLDKKNNYVNRTVIINKLNSQKPQFLNKLIRRLQTNITQNNNSKLTQFTKQRLLKPGFANNQV